MATYLIFDLEYATSKGGSSKICEFGYVMTNEEFKIIQKGNFIIDPYINREDWDWRVVKTILTRKVWEYEKSKRFNSYYDKIVELIHNADYILGHSLDGDAKALNDDCKRYGLDSINFDFYDIKLFYKAFNNSKNDTSVTDILSNLKIEGDKRNHDAEADAYNTMLELQEMLNQLKVSLEELIELCPEARNKNKDFVVESIELNQMIRKEKFEKFIKDGDGNSLRYGPNNRMFHQFLDNVQPQDGYDKKLIGLKYSISMNYEDHHFKQMLNIVQLLCNYGATYVLKASDADVFVKYDCFNEDGTLRYCSRLNRVKKEIEDGKQISILSFDDFMNTLGITEKELDEMPMVSFDCLYRKDAIIKDRKTKKVVGTNKEQESNKKVASSKTTFGEILSDYYDKRDDNNDEC